MAGPRSRSVTSRDVARVSGVSQATVSYVINNVTTQKISPETRERVLQAARDLGYTPSESARALRSGRSKIALLVFPDFQLSYGIDKLVQSLSAELTAMGITLVLHRLSEGSAPLRTIWRAISPGVIIGLGALDEEEQREIREAGIDVAMFRLSQRASGAEGIMDYQQDLGQIQVDHLVSKGHSRIGYALPTDDFNVESFWRPRAEGVREALMARGLDEPLEIAVPIELEGAIAAVREWKAAGVTAVATYNDDIALAVLGALNAAGIAVPEEMAVIGVDAVPLGAVSVPALTSIEIDMRHLAVQFSRLVERLHLREGHDQEPPLESIRAVVVERAST
jgi:DNA-binding LacI/PurR family transcriptional regulator